MIRVLLFMLVCLPMAAQVIVSKSALTFTRYVGRANPEPRKGEAGNFVEISTASGTMAWTSTITGQLTTACDSGPCVWFVSEYSQASGSHASGTATTTPARYAVRWRWASTLAVGTYTGTITITPTTGTPSTIALTLNVVNPPMPFAQVLAKAGYPQGCTNSNAAWPWTDSCTTDRMPMVTETQPAVGATRTDANFGHTVTYSFPYGCQTGYGGLKAFSASTTYVWASGLNGSSGCGIRALSDNSLLRAYPGAFPSGFAAGNASWSGVDDNVMYWFDFSDPRLLKRWDVVANTTSTLLDFTARGITGIFTGGQMGTSRDDWFGFAGTLAGNRVLCMADLQGARRGTVTAASVPCVNIQAYESPNWVSAGPRDRATGIRYGAALVGTRGTLIVRLMPDGSTDSFLMPDRPESPNNNNEDGTCDATETCSGEPHGVMFADADGVVHMWLHALELVQQSCSPKCSEAYASSRLSAGAEAMTNLPGGGLRTVWPGFGVGYQQSSFPAAYSYELNNRTAAMVNSATAANPTVITATSAQTSPAAITGWTVGQSIRITGAAGGTFSSCLDGLWTISAVTGNQITIPANCSGAGTYTAQSAMVGDATPQPAASPHLNTVFLFGPPGQNWVRPVFNLRNAGWTGIATSNDAAPPYVSTYNYSPRCSASWDESKIACTTNDGYLTPLATRVVVADTGYSTSTRFRQQVDAGDTFAILRFTQASVNGCTFNVYASPSSFTSPVATATHPGTLSGSVVLTGLTASTRYLVRANCGSGGGADAIFTTGPAFSATTTLHASKGGGGDISHGPTSALGSTCTSPCALTVSRGLYYLDTGPVVAR